MNYFIDTNNEDIERILKLEIPPTPSRMGWLIDYDYLSDWVAKHLKYPVRIRWASGKWRYGTHYARNRDDDKYHRIVLNQNRTKESANNTLWHELCHALQSEAIESEGHDFSEFYRKFYVHAKGEWGASYEKNDYEIEAREFAIKMEHIKLIKKG